MMTLTAGRITEGTGLTRREAVIIIGQVDFRGAELFLMEVGAGFTEMNHRSIKEMGEVIDLSPDHLAEGGRAS